MEKKRSNQGEPGGPLKRVSINIVLCFPKLRNIKTFCHFDIETETRLHLVRLDTAIII